MNDDTISIKRTVPPVINSATLISKPPSLYPTEVIDLPSKGYFYSESDPLSSGKVEIKMMTAREEDILTNENLIKKGTVLDRFLKSILIDTSINIDNLLVADKNALFIASRRLSYGDTYGPIKIECKSCGEDNNNVNINLAEMVEKPYEFEQYTKNVNSFEYTLPYSKRVVRYKILTGKDENDIAEELKSLSRISNSKNSAEVTTHMKHIIVSIDGKEDRASINAFVDKELLARDSTDLRKHIRNNSLGIDTTFNFVCEHCSHEERVGMPFQVSFFWPDTGR
jgi:hypothetical protein